MRALQDFEEEDKLQIKMNDVITIIEGRSVCHSPTHTHTHTQQYFNQITGFESLACVCQCRLDTTTNASFVDTGFLALLEIIIITVTLLAHSS